MANGVRKKEEKYVPPVLKWGPKVVKKGKEIIKGSRESWAKNPYLATTGSGGVPGGGGRRTGAIPSISDKEKRKTLSHVLPTMITTTDKDSGKITTKTQAEVIAAGKKGVPQTDRYGPNYRGPDYSGRPRIKSGSGEGVYGTPATGRLAQANEAALETERMKQRKPARGIPKMDLSSPGGVIAAMNAIAPMAMETGVANARARREKAALSMGVDIAKIDKLTAETLSGIPQDIKTKQSTEALNRAKTETAGLDWQRKIKAWEAATLTGTFDQVEYDKAYESLGGITGKVPTLEEFLKLASEKNPDYSVEEITKIYNEKYGK